MEIGPAIETAEFKVSGLIDCVLEVPDLPSWKPLVVDKKLSSEKFQPDETAV